MRKLLYLFFALVLFSCSSEDSEQRASGQYLFQNDTLTMAIKFVDNGDARVHIFVRDNIWYQDLYARYVGEYPNYILYAQAENEPLTMTCNFSSTTDFTGNVTSSTSFSFYWIYRLLHITIPQTMYFKKDSRILDTNGDGVLDWTQDL